MPTCHWQASEDYIDEYLAMAGCYAQGYAPIRNKYVPGGQMWVIESGDAGGNTWGSTYLEVLRTLNELGDFASVSDGIVFHNTLASSDYGFLQHGTFDPRPTTGQFCCGIPSWPPLSTTAVTLPWKAPSLLPFPQRRQGRKGLSDHQQLPHQCSDCGTAR